MNERPILFSGAMVRAILDGRKTQTRRVVKPQPKNRPMRTPFVTGGKLWVRETFAPCIGGAEGPDNPTLYRADNLEHYDQLRWKPSIFMPRWASRITLEVTGVRVERLQAISAADAEAEGMERGPLQDNEPAGEFIGRLHHRSAAELRYRSLWDSLNAKRGFGWEANPWVWVIEFRKL